jgi:hypothetical protein
MIFVLVDVERSKRRREREYQEEQVRMQKYAEDEKKRMDAYIKRVLEECDKNGRPTNANERTN